MDADTNDAAETLGDFALLPNETLEHMFTCLHTAADACHLSMACCAFHEMASSQRLWRALYRSFSAVDPGAVPETWGKDWRWLCRARTTPANDSDPPAIVCGTRAYYGGCAIYHGELVGAMPDGYGVMVFVANASKMAPQSDPRVLSAHVWSPSKGCRFEGRWTMGVFVDGRCAFSHDSARYEGDWKDNMHHGYGTYVTKSGTHYEGQWERGKAHGHGIEIDDERGFRFEGSYVDGEWRGRGVMLCANGKRCEGNWQRGNLHGDALVVYEDGSRYEGGYAHGKRDGRGSILYRSGARYEGDWKGGVYHGQGTYQFAHGIHLEGLWRDGAFISAMPSPVP